MRRASVFGKRVPSSSSSSPDSAPTIQYNLPSFLQKKNPFNPNTQAKHLNFVQAHNDKENLYYQIFPAQESGVPKGILIVAHSFASHVGQLENIGVRFSSSNYCVAMYDQRGSGRSGGKRGHCKSLQQYLVDLLTVVKETRRQLVEDLRKMDEMLTEESVNKIPIFLYGHGTGSVMLLLFGLQISIMRRSGGEFNKEAFMTLVGQELSNTSSNSSAKNSKLDEEEEVLNQSLSTLLKEIEPAIAGLIATAPYLRIEFPNWQKKVIGFLAKRFQTYTIDLDVPVDKLTSDLAMQKTLHRDTFRVGDMTAKTVTDLEKLCMRLLKEEVTKQFELPLLMLHGTKDYVADATMSKKLFDQVGSTDKSHFYLANFLHAVHLEVERERMFQLITTWLNERSHANPSATHYDDGESRVNQLVNSRANVAASTKSHSPVPTNATKDDADFELEDVEPTTKTDAAATDVTENESQDVQNNNNETVAAVEATATSVNEEEVNTEAKPEAKPEAKTEPEPEPQPQQTEENVTEPKEEPVEVEVVEEKTKSVPAEISTERSVQESKPSEDDKQKEANNVSGQTPTGPQSPQDSIEHLFGSEER